MEMADWKSLLLGGIGGAVISGVFLLIQQVIARKHERDLQFVRARIAVTEHHLDNVRDAYLYILNCCSEIAKGGHPDRASRGSAFAQASLFGTREIRERVQRFLDARQGENPQLLLDELIDAMSNHITRLENCISAK